MAEQRHLEALSVGDCFDLVRQHVVGRLAIYAGDGPPFVAPVTFVLVDRSIFFQTDPGEKLDAVGQHATFQVDELDHQHRTGWSVLLQGTLGIPDDDDVAHLKLQPWVGRRAFWVRLVPDVVTGRRIELLLPDVDGRGYR